MKKILLGLLLTCSVVATAQVHNNEWIDYSKTYYKFKLGKDGLYRIPQAVLASAGLGATPAEHFQLWRNGEQVPIYTSVASGALPVSGYVEFWGRMNDGKPDRQLYRNASYQLNDKWSLLTDTATYFLTVNTVVAENLRLEGAANNLAGNTLPAEPYFMYTAGNYFKNKINNGYAVPVGENLYSSSYDKGEGWSSTDIETKAVDSLTINYGSNTSTLNNLFVYNGGPSPSFKISVSGNAVIARRYKVTINGDSVLGNQVNFFDFATDSTTFALSKILTNTASVVVTNIASVGCYDLPGTGYTCQRDRMVIHKYELTYPRLFNFGGASNFEFKLPASAIGNYLEITNFSAGTVTPPVLYDLTNNKRYVADMSTASVLKFVLPPSGDTRNFVLVSEDASNLNSIAALETRNFIDYSSSDKVGDYLIISNSVLFNGANGTNPVEDYKAYRSSNAGGAYNAQVYLADQLIDQFGFGIKKHPLGIRNFIRFARLTYPVQPKYVFIIGRGVMYVHQKTYESNANPVVRDNLAKLNLVPTFGYPASDILLTAEPGSSLPLIPIGRLSVINPQEISDYLNKVKEYEAVQASTSSSAADKMWMKNVVHIVGASDEKLDDILTNSMDGFKKIITDTSFGAKVSTFSKHSANDVEQLSSADLTNLINQGTSLITYFGHSSSTTLEFNLDNPENYTNQGKYPFFFGLGCNAGNFFSYSTTRLATKETISEKYVLTPNRGTIGFIASTHFGIVHYLDIWNTRAYKRITKSSYGKSIGEIVRLTAKDVFDAQSEEDFYARANIEETELHGDPAIALNAPVKPDYVIEDPMVKVSPGFVSVADASFRLDAKFLNIGKAGENVAVEVKRQLPDQSVSVIKRDTIFRTSDRASAAFSRFEDSISITIPIEPNHDKGLNKIIVTVDVDNEVDEIFETNNSVTKEVMIYEDEARPIYPYNYAIVNMPTVKLIASTANPFSPSKEYRMEMDTTALFNSPFRIVKTVTTAGGTMSFDPGITFTDSTVYYWRVAPVPASGPYSWNTASFIYLPNSDFGFNQSHYYQHLKSANDKVILNPDTRKWDYGSVMQNLFIRQGTWATSSGQQIAFSVAVNAETIIQIASWFQSLMFNVFDPVTFKPWKNEVVIPALAFPDKLGSGLYNSLAPQNFAQAEPLPYNFEFRYTDTSSRRKIMDFMRDVIPDGAYVVVRNFTLDPSVNTAPNFPISYASDWAKDTALHGQGQSVYHYLKDAGLAGIDSFYRARPFALVYKKGDPSFTPKWMMGEGVYDNPTLSVDCPTIDTVGFITSPKFGPAKEWKELKWRGSSLDNSEGDYPTLSILGYKNNGQVDTLFTGLDVTQQSFDISSVNAVQYPYLQLQMRNIDSVHYTPYQLRFWRLNYVPAPEGAVSPNIFFSMRDTVDVAEPLEFKMAFQNVSGVDFPDSIKVKAVITDRNNVTHVLAPWKQRSLSASPDTLHIRYAIDTRQLVGANSIYVEVNPDNDQPEQYHFNNFFYKNFYVRPDTLNPLMDVTFDNVHILNHDIVSAKPNIMIKLKDEAKWFLLSDTSTVSVQVRFPDGSLVDYYFDGTTMEFVPAQQAPSTDNTATVNLKPTFDQDGEYELIVTGKDMSENSAGSLQYRVAFQVYNKPMISNMLNYPNPFTTSTAFVFTVTGSEVPQNIRIQIMTVTGKIVREITKDELGPLRVGRNITEFKWDGTDQYGQKLANGIYLYRVVTNLNGKSLDRFIDANDNTDKYFNKGYGKMYLMR